MPIELHVPDLPPLTLGPEAGLPRPRLPLLRRLREAVATYLPLLLMALLALATWWLVRHTPLAPPPAEVSATRHEPDYTMQRFLLQRFGPDGRLRVQVEGEQLRHFPHTDTLEIDTVRILAVRDDGTQTHATARRAIANGDATEVQLLGGAQVRSGGVEFEGEFVHAFLATERLRSHLPAVVRRDGSVLRAAGFEYDHLSRTLRLKGPVRAVFQPGRGG